MKKKKKKISTREYFDIVHNRKLQSSTHNVHSWTVVETDAKSQPFNNGNPKSASQPPEEIYKNLKVVLSGSMISDDHSILKEIERAEKLAGCTIDFQI